MSRRPLRTSDVARAVGIHPNTVRLYEAWGFLPPIPRARNGYRQFTPAHLEQVRLVRLALRATWLGGAIRRVALATIRCGAEGDLPAALDQARALRQLVGAAQARAEAAADVLESWASLTESPPGEEPSGLSIGQAARHLGVTVDMLRNWERNGLVAPARDARHGYRIYGPADLARLRVIRTLRQARYSTMAILRMLTALDTGQRDGLRAVLDTPAPNELPAEDAFYATDHWLTTLREIVASADAMVQLLEWLTGEPA